MDSTEPTNHAKPSTDGGSSSTPDFNSFTDTPDETLVIDPEGSIYKQVWKWFFEDLHWVPPTFLAGIALLTVGFYLVNVIAGCSAKLCNAWPVWIGGAAVVVGGFMALLGSAQLIAYLIQVRSIKNKMSLGIEVVLRRKKASSETQT
ncbi:MAG: hypothetical protein M1143_04225 [Candidatus Thermoplasmatota archaeon]|jgi:hypothetical protein|nr:hypothetical protein [Candidatus Thermoplasmatota archaeon]